MKLCFVGLGTMGLPMALRLTEVGFEVAGWDTSAEAGKELAGRCQSLEHAFLGADVVITMLPEGSHVADIHKQLRSMKNSECRILIDCSTIDVATVGQLAEHSVAAGWGFIDAPVSGGAEGARDGALSFMLGGNPDDIETAMPIFEAMGKKVQYFGEVGSGQAAKACHNMICGITALGVCEAFALADSLGLDQQKFYDLCAGAAAQSWILENRCPVPGPAPDAPASNGYTPGFAARLMAKDLRLAQAAAKSSGQSTPFGEEAARRFTNFATNSTDGDLDFSAIYRVIRQA